MEKVRLDKWLWAARFYKTRSLSKQAIDGGKVRVNGDRPKASKEIVTGVLITLRQGWDDKEVRVLKLSEQRRSASEAQTLYEETETSVQQREKRALERKSFGGIIATASKPNTKERRQLQRIKRDQLDGE